MKKMRVHQEQECALVSVEDLLREHGRDEATIKALPEEALLSKMRFYEMGTENSPQLFESQLPPHTVAPPHSHTEDEIIYILDGEMVMGTKTYKKGTSVFVAANAMYGFKAGPSGLKFLNFRPRRCDF
jgi:quercetin dioxygenase-like cupin family protein